MCARVLFSLAVVWALAFPALAQDRRGAQSLDRVLPEIRRSTPGTFYDAQGPFVGPNGQSSYRIKWMTPEGRIIWFYADARTGQVYGAAPGNAPNPLPQSNRLRNDYPDRFRDGGWPAGDGNDNSRSNRGDRNWSSRGDGNDNSRWNRGNRDWSGRGDGNDNSRWNRGNRDGNGDGDRGGRGRRHGR